MERNFSLVLIIKNEIFFCFALYSHFQMGYRLLGQGSRRNINRRREGSQYNYFNIFIKNPLYTNTLAQIEGGLWPLPVPYLRSQIGKLRLTRYKSIDQLSLSHCLFQFHLSFSSSIFLLNFYTLTSITTFIASESSFLITQPYQPILSHFPHKHI